MKSKSKDSSGQSDFVQIDDEKFKRKVNCSTDETVSITSLFRFAKSFDFLLISIGSVAAIIHGIQLPIILLIFGNIIDLFTNRSIDHCSWNYTMVNEYCPPSIRLNPTNFFNDFEKCDFSSLNLTLPENDFLPRIRDQSIFMAVIGFAAIIVGYFQVSFWSIAAERQTRLLRQTLFSSLLKKDVEFFDSNKTGELNSRLNEDVQKFHDGIGDKIGSLLQFIAGFVAGFIIGFIRGWKLTLAILCVGPLLFITSALMSKVISKMTSNELKAYARAGSIAEEVFSNVRTVLAYNGSNYEAKRYEGFLRNAKLSGIRKGAFSGLMMGMIWFLLFCVYALGFWYGAKLVREENFSIGRILTVFFTIIVGIFNLGHAAPQIQTLAQSRAAAATLWKIIDKKSKISTNDQTGIKRDLVGNVEFRNVRFSYPSRESVDVLKRISFTAQSGKTTAIVGTSGCGKSTCIQLIQRFYDVNDGSIEIDGTKIEKFDLNHLRRQIGVVSQEATLFQMTIRQNISLGRLDANFEEIKEAAKMANAHDFIVNLPDGYDTLIGERGAQLSGGQKQRIAIARALIKNPRLLLLDEATSALDTESERLVQEALDRASKGRTTIVVAHRLSTIQNADEILVFDKGSIIERGDHSTLINHRGVYFDLVQFQNFQTKNDHCQVPEDEPILPMEFSFSQHDQSTQIMEKSFSRIENPKKEKYSGPSPFISMLKMNRPELVYIVFGCLACVVNGGIQPLFAVIYSRVIGVFQECDHFQQKQEILFYATIFLVLGFLLLVTMFLQNFLFAVSGESLTERLRGKMFRCLLSKEVEYFDQAENNSGALCTRLSSEASDVQGATGVRIGTIIQNFSNLGVGILLALIYGWKLTLLMLAFVPFVVLGGFLQTYLLTGFADRDKKSLEKAGQISVEAIGNIRTVVQLNQENYFLKQFSKVLESPFRNSIKRAHIFGILFSTSDAVIFFCQAALFSFGAWLVEQGSMTFVDVMLVFNCLLFGAMAVGQSTSMAPDYSKAIVAAKNILTLFQGETVSFSGKTLENLRGEIIFKNLRFSYPNRSEVEVLKDFDLTIESNKKIALVGASGCGKSTIIQLIERFYGPTDGEILVDGNFLSKIDLHWWRNQIGFVNQEPVLFDCTIRENIAYGDPNRPVSIDEVVRAARRAKVDRFIESLPEKYETNVGPRGTQLSGGEKQRIAIARALIKNPKILLLDEATSALDSESEALVQAALDRASEGRTTIVIAHRISTIRNAEKIFVFHHGKIVESGSHDELVALRKHYYRLTQKQQ